MIPSLIAFLAAIPGPVFNPGPARPAQPAASQLFEIHPFNVPSDCMTDIPENYTDHRGSGPPVEGTYNNLGEAACAQADATRRNLSITYADGSSWNGVGGEVRIELPGYGCLTNPAAYPELAVGTDTGVVRFETCNGQSIGTVEGDRQWWYAQPSSTGAVAITNRFKFEHYANGGLEALERNGPGVVIRVPWSGSYNWMISPAS